MKVLGLDMGTNSLGWAYIDTKTETVVGMGSRIFPEGVENLGQGMKELSKNASRTGNRQTRRQLARRRFRKRLVLKVLSAQGMAPLSESFIQNWDSSTPFPEAELREWFKMNPYELRAKGLNEALSLEEFGRVLYHLTQRRGFLSNARKASTDDDGKIFTGKPKEHKTGILETRELSKETTLGDYLHSIQPVHGAPYKEGQKRIRNRYTTREMYVREFEELWAEQSQHHSILTDELKTRLGGQKTNGDKKDGILFYQRPLRSQKSKVGKCQFEKSKTKCPINALPFEEFRLWQWVNSVEFDSHRLNGKQRQQAFDYLITREKATFKAVRKHLGLADTLIKSNYQDSDKIVGSNTNALLSKKDYFGSRWMKMDEEEKENIWHAMYFYDDKRMLAKKAFEQWGIDKESADKLAGTNLKDGYANLSRKAILNILPFLRMGFHYDKAVTMAGVKNLFGQRWEKLSEQEIDSIIDHVYDITKKKKKGGYAEELMTYLNEEFDFDRKAMERKLYHHSAEITISTTMDKLPLGIEADREIQAIRNPVVITAMFELRKLINELIERFGKPDRIVMEMARDLKQSKTARQDVRSRNKKLEEYNDKMIKELKSHNMRISHDNILLIKLWYECQKTCPYTGRNIGIQDLFSGEVQIEHILPYSRSLNDSYMNKTLCYADENRNKGDRTPFEYYSGMSEAKWDEVRARALNLFHDTAEFPNRYRKFKQFAKKAFDEDFISRQLNDTRYISKSAKDYLSKVCEDVRVTPGQLTAKLRHHWGLNSVLGEEDKKERDDHRHHAIDAITVACTTQAMVQKASAQNRYRDNTADEGLPLPWQDFRIDVERAVHGIIVSHRRQVKDITVRDYTVVKKGVKHTNRGISARGQLHLETVYGQRKSPHHEDEGYHVRKSVESLTTYKQVEKVVDPRVKDLLHRRVESLGGYTGDKKDKVPKGAFFDLDPEGVPIPAVFLPNKNGAPVPIKKVRIRENLGGAEELNDGQGNWVNLRNNHHVLVYRNVEGELKEDVVSFWTVVERKKQGLETVILPDDGETIEAVLHINDIYSLRGADDIRRIYRVQKLTSGIYVFRLHSESTIQSNTQPQFIRIQSFGDGKTGWLTYEPTKVLISTSGELST